MPSFDPVDAFAELVVCVVFHMPRHTHSTGGSGHASSDEEAPDARAPQSSLRSSFRLDNTGCRIHYQSGGGGRYAGTAAVGNDAGHAAALSTGADECGWVPQRDSLADLYELYHAASLHHAHTRAAAAAAQAFSRPSSIGSFISVNTVPATRSDTPLSQPGPTTTYCPVHELPSTSTPILASPSGGQGRSGSRLGWPFTFSRRAPHAAAASTPPDVSLQTHSAAAPRAGGTVGRDASPSPGTTDGSCSFIPITEEELARGLMSPGSWAVEMDTHTVEDVPDEEGDPLALAHPSVCASVAYSHQQKRWTPTGQHLSVQGRGVGAAGHNSSSPSNSGSYATVRCSATPPTSPSRVPLPLETLAAGRRGVTGAVAASGEATGDVSNSRYTNSSSSTHTSLKGSTMPSAYTSISDFVEV